MLSSKPIVVLRVINFFKFGNVQLLDMLNFLCGATSLDSFLKAYKTSETKGYFPYGWFNNPDKLNNTQILPYEAFFNKLRNNNPLEKEYRLSNVNWGRLEIQRSIIEIKIESTTSNWTGKLAIFNQCVATRKHVYLQWFFPLNVFCSNVASYAERGWFFHKEIDLLKVGCSLSNLANFWLQKSSNAKFYLFKESDKNLLEKIREDMVDGLSVVFTRKADVRVTLIRDSTNWCKTILGINASKFYSYSMCQVIPTGLYTRCELDSESGKIKSRQNETRNFENMVMSYFQRFRPYVV